MSLFSRTRKKPAHSILPDMTRISGDTALQDGVGLVVQDEEKIERSAEQDQELLRNYKNSPPKRDIPEEILMRPWSEDALKSLESDVATTCDPPKDAVEYTQENDSTRLWNKAYNSIKDTDKDLVNVFEKVLSRQITGGLCSDRNLRCHLYTS